MSSAATNADPYLGSGREGEEVAIEFSQFPFNSSSSVYETGRLAKSGPGTLYGFQGYSSRASAQFIQAFDLPSFAQLTSASVPVFFLTVNATGNYSASFGTLGRRFLQGIVVVNSSTGPTYTAGSADTWFDIQYA